MRWFTRASLGLAIAVCAWIAWPSGAVSAGKAPEVHSVIEGRDDNRQPIVILIGERVSALKTLTVMADDGVRAAYSREASLVTKSKQLAVWRLPEAIEAERGSDFFDLHFTYGRSRKALDPINVRLDFGAAPPQSVRDTSIANASLDSHHLSAGLLADLGDATTLDGFDAAYFTDAGNLTGTLDTSRFSAWDDLLNEENRVGTSAGQVAPGDHVHDLAYPTRAELADNGGVLNDPNNTVDWSQLKNVPNGLADGADMDTTYDAGDGLRLSGTTFSVDYGGGGSDTEVARADHTHTGTYQPVFNAGAGLSLVSGTLSTLFGGTGGAASSARSDHDHDLRYSQTTHSHDASYFTESELSSTGVLNTSSNPVDWSKLKNVPGDFADGTDDDTQYLAGAGLTLSSGTFSANLAGSGAANTVARSDHDHTGTFAASGHNHDTSYATKSELGNVGIANAGANPVDWTKLKGIPASLLDGDDDTTYSAGDGVSLATGTFSVEFGGSGSAATSARSDHHHDAAYATLGHTHTASSVDVSASSGIAVKGEVTATAGSTTGVHGEVASTDGSGGYFENTSAPGSATGFGVYAKGRFGLFVEGTKAGFTPFIVELTDTSSSGNLAAFKYGSDVKVRFRSNGEGLFDGGTTTGGADFAESVAVNAPKDAFEPGDVIVIDTAGVRRFAVSSEASSPLVAGIYSTKPGVLARPGPVAGPGDWEDTEIPLAITGIVPCKVCDENGPVQTGDLLVTSSTPGYAMKAPEDPKAGTLVGKALEPLDGERGKVEVLITMR